MAPNLDAFFKQVDTLSETFIERLRKAVAIPSISAEDARRPDVVRVSYPFPAHPVSMLMSLLDGQVPGRRAEVSRRSCRTA